MKYITGLTCILGVMVVCLKPITHVNKDGSVVMETLLDKFTRRFKQLVNYSKFYQ